jgi:hypothetical protein
MLWPPANLYGLIDLSDRAIRNRGSRWHMFEEKRKAVMAIEAAAASAIGLAT